MMMMKLWQGYPVLPRSVSLETFALTNLRSKDLWELGGGDGCFGVVLFTSFCEVIL